MSKNFSKLFSIILILALMIMALPMQNVQAISTSLVINEIDYDQPSTDTAEFIELKNVGAGAVDLDSYDVLVVNGSGGGASIARTLDLPSFSLAAGEYYVICANAANVNNCDLDVSPDTDLIQNGAPDAVALVQGSTVIDTVSYEGDTGAPYTEGSGAGLLDDPSVDSAGISRYPDGIDTDQNNVDFSLRCSTPGEANVLESSDCLPVEPAMLVINEIDYDQPTPPTSDSAEFVEIKNVGIGAVNLNSYDVLIVNGTGGGASIATTIDLPSVSLAAGDYYVICGDAANVANCDLDVTPDTNLIQNGAPDAVALVQGSTVIDTVSYEGDTGAPYTEGSGAGLEDAGADGSISRCPDGTDTNQNNADFVFIGTITPGAANDCPPPVSPDVVISEIRIDQPGGDDDEYFELAADPGTSLDGLTYLVIGDGTGGSGVIENVTNLTGNMVPASGYFVAAENTFTLGTADLTTNLNFENGDNVTHLLVRDFSGSNAQDLDTNDDGVLDVTPWSEVVDLIALIVEDNPPSGTEYHYGPPTVGPDGSFVPGHAFSCPGGWLIGPFDPVGGEDTPGTANNCPPPVIVINEIMQNPAAVSDSAGEWLELYNPLGYDVDINGWTILDNGSDSHVIDNGGPLFVPAGGFLVLGNNANQGTNGGVLVDYQYSGYFLANGDDEVILLDGDLTEIDRVEYDGGPAFPDPTGASMQLKDADLDNNFGENWCEGLTPFGAGDLGTPGAANVCDVFIHEVQGAGAESPLKDSIVVVEGIVVGDFQHDYLGGSDGLDGFFVQEEDGDVDSDPLTSEGVFVYNGNLPAVEVEIGDLVRVQGSVSEFNGMTEITSFSGVSVLGNDNPLPTVSVLSLPVTAVADFEAYEGMYVTFQQELVISEYFNFDRFGEIVLTSRRHLTPTAEFEPGSSEEMQAVQDFLLDRITLDDGRTIQNPDPAIHPNGDIFDLNNLFRGGDTVKNVTGVINYDFGLYRVQPTQGADYTNTNPRTASPDPVGGNLKVSSFNVLNYFTTLDNGSCPYSGGCRGADDAGEFTRQRDKIIAALAEIDADVVGLLEIENHPSDVSTADLVSGLNAAVGANTYAYVSTGAIGTDAIKVALIYKPASVSLIGDYAVLDSTVDSRFIDTKNRPTLAQTFMNNSTGGVFTVAVNHLKSKGSDCNDVGDPDTGDGSGNCNLTRKAAAEALVDWLATDPTGSGDADFLIIGDLNSYDKEDPIDAILAGADDVLGTDDDYTDMVFAFQGEDAYSYVFDGQLGYLDHALANKDMMDQITGVIDWHINADEPDLIDYDTSFKRPNQDALYAPDAYRSSDHDPVIIGLRIFDFQSPVANLPAFNTVKAGQSVPIKFSLDGFEGLDILAAGYPMSGMIACDSTDLLHDGESTESAGSSVLSYDPVTDTYTYVWKTSKSWAGTCRQLVVKLDDGTFHRANFNFTD